MKSNAAQFSTIALQNAREENIEILKENTTLIDQYVEKTFAELEAKIKPLSNINNRVLPKLHLLRHKCDNMSEDTLVIESTTTKSSLPKWNRIHTNLKEALSELELYRTIEVEVEQLHANFNFNNAVVQYERFYQWKSRFMTELVSKKFHPALKRRFDAIALLETDITSYVHQVIVTDILQIAQFDPQTLSNVTRIISKSARLLEIFNIETLLKTGASSRIRHADCSVDAFLESATNLVLDLNIVQTEVSPCFSDKRLPLDIYINVYDTFITTSLKSITLHNMAERLAVIEWMTFYQKELKNYGKNNNAELESYITSVIQDYVVGVKSQLSEWITNVFKNQEDISMSQDILKLLTSQVTVASSHLREATLVLVVQECLMTTWLNISESSYVQSVKQKSIEVQCALVNDIDSLQGSITDGNIMTIVSPSIEDPPKREALLEFVDSISSRFVNLAVKSCENIVTTIFDEVQYEIINLWFKSHDWLCGDNPVASNLCATLEDYFNDFSNNSWINSSFFFSKILRACLDKCVLTFMTRFKSVEIVINDPKAMSRRIESDFEVFYEFYKLYLGPLKRTGIRSEEHLRNALAPIKQLGKLIQTPLSVLLEEKEDEVTLLVVKRLLGESSNSDSTSPKKKLIKALNPFNDKKPKNPFEEKSSTKNPFEKKPVEKKSTNPFSTTSNLNDFLS